MTWGLHILIAGFCSAEYMMASCNSASTVRQADVSADVWAARSCLAVTVMGSNSTEQHCPPVARVFVKQM